jgi:ribosomal protein S18 acetylase RimI-like enzyme
VSFELVGFSEEHLSGVLQLHAEEGWPSLPEDPQLAQRACTAPGVVSLVATEDDEVIGFARLLTDGALDAYLCELVVAGAVRRRGVGRALVAEALARSGARRLDLLAEDGSEEFYRSFPHRALPGYRVYPARP